MCTINRKLEKGLQWSVGDGRSIRFWQDKWLPSGIALEEVIVEEVPEDVANRKLAFFVNNEGG